MKRLSEGMMFAAVGMGLAVALLMLFAANVTPHVWLSIICLFVASVMTWVPAREDHGLLYGLITYVVTSGLALLICRGVYTYLYVLLFGNFGLMLLVLRRYIQDKLLRVLVLLLYCNVMIAAGVAFAAYVLYYDVRTFIPELPLWAIILIAEGGLCVYFLLYRICTDLFDTHCRKALLPRR